MLDDIELTDPNAPWLELDPCSDQGPVREAEAIRGHRFAGGVIEYHVKWKGRPESDNTWEAEDSPLCHGVVDDYLKEGCRLIAERYPMPEHVDFVGVCHRGNVVYYLIRDTDNSVYRITAAEAMLCYSTDLVEFLHSTLEPA
jgi:hypothetical protein